VLTEPDIYEPMQIAFDGNGRMFVLEILSYMQDADATGELDPISRISVHEDQRTSRIIVFATIDNLYKGTSSQAVQNLNLMFGLDESMGLPA
jgi:N-acetyl-gamma-glutamylphosphate reductase